MINLKTVDFDKLEKLTRVTIPGTETNTRLSGYFGYIEPKERYNKLVAYGPQDNTLQLTWIHKEYLAK
jgi:hypothetical protein